MIGMAFLKRLASLESSDLFRTTAVGLHAVQLYESVRCGAFENVTDREPVREFALSLAADNRHRHTYPDLWASIQGVAAALPSWGTREHWNDGREAVYAALLQYAKALSNHDEWELAIDILQIVAIDAAVDGENYWAAQAHLLLGFCYRTLADWSNSALSYQQAYTVAHQAGAFSVALRARIGEANNKVTKGDIPGAFKQLATTLRSAYGKCPEIVPRVVLAQANVANVSGQFERAIQLAYRALMLAEDDHEAQYPILVDIAQFFADYGVPDVACDALQLVADTAPEHLVRAHALINLLFISANQGEEDAFERIRDRLGREALRPRQETLSQLFQAQGHLRFGRVLEAREAADRAASLARQHGFHQYSFQVEEEIRKIDQAEAVRPYDGPTSVRSKPLHHGRPTSRGVTRIADQVRNLVAAERRAPLVAVAV